MTGQERHALIELLEGRGKDRREMLKSLKVPESTYYYWRKLYLEGGPLALDKNGKTVARKVWNRLTREEDLLILRIGREHPELSPRLLAVKITDEEEFAISESTVYRVLKQHGLVAPRPLPEMPAAPEWRHKTTRINEIWQIDATNLFVVGWGFYKLIPVLDDFSRKIIAWVLMPDETCDSISHAVERAIEAVGLKNWSTDEDRPKLLSDNGAGFVAEALQKYLSYHGIRHIFGKPYHPQTQGKVERFNRRIKEGLCLLVYCSPDELERAIREAIERYNSTPHEALKNVSPDDVYAGRQQEILERREKKKSWTIARRKIVNLEMGEKSYNQAGTASKL